MNQKLTSAISIIKQNMSKSKLKMKQEIDEAMKAVTKAKGAEKKEEAKVDALKATAKADGKASKENFLARAKEKYTEMMRLAKKKQHERLKKANEKFDKNVQKDTKKRLPKIAAVKKNSRGRRNLVQLLSGHTVTLRWSKYLCESRWCGKSDIELEELKRKNEQTVVTEHGRKKRASLEHEEKVVKASQERQVAVIASQEKTSVQKAEANALLQRTSTEVQKHRVETISKAEAEAEAKRVQADIAFENTTLNAEAEKNKLVNDAEAIKLDAGAEKEASKHLIEKRKFELDLREKEILNKLAAKGNFNLIGEPGDKMVQAMMTGEFSSKDAGSPGSGGGGGWFRR